MKREQHPNLIGLICGFIFIVVFALVAISADLQPEIDFETQILPVLKNRCFSCHSAPKSDTSGAPIRKPKGGVQLDSVKGIEASLMIPFSTNVSRYLKVILASCHRLRKVIR